MELMNNNNNSTLLCALPLEIITNILEYLSMKDLIKLSRANKELRGIIKNTRLSHVVKLIGKNFSNKKLMYVIKNYNFINYDFSSSKITDTELEILSKIYCRKISIFWCIFVTDIGIKAVSDCRCIDASYCRFITDEGIKLLSECYSVNVSGTSITDEGIKSLGKCNTVDLSNCDKITDNGILALKNCHSVYLNGGKLITSKGVEELRKYGCIVYF